jgi:methionine-rich copper-binding protein CopC
MSKVLRTALAFVIALSAVMNLQVTAAFAHSDLVSSDPEAGSVLEAMPTSVLLTFNEDLLILEGAEDANQLLVTDNQGTSLTAGELLVAANTISSALSPSSASGEITVTYRVVSADGHPIEGSYTFSVGEPMVIAPNPTSSESHSSPAADWTPLFLALVAVFTALALLLIYRRKKSSN